MGQCITLALLLHILLVLVFGTTPGGTARPGEGVWGALNVTLRGAENAPHPPSDSPGAARLDPWRAKAVEPISDTADKPSKPRARPEVKPFEQAPTTALEPVQAPAPTGTLMRAVPPIETPSSIAQQAPDLTDIPASLSAFDQIKSVIPLAAPAPAHASEAAPVPAPAPTPTSAPVPSPTPVPAHAAAPSPTNVPPLSTLSEKTPVAAPERSTAATPSLSAVPSLGAPDAGSRLGHDVATPPSVPASAPRLSLDLSLPRGGALSSRSGRGLLQLMAPPPETQSKLTEGMEKSAREDCRKAYGGAGLLAVVPLAIDAARDKGCRW